VTAPPGVEAQWINLSIRYGEKPIEPTPNFSDLTRYQSIIMPFAQFSTVGSVARQSLGITTKQTTNNQKVDLLK